MSRDDFVSPREAAEILGITPARLGALARERRIRPAIELPNYRVYARADVLVMAAERAEQARTDPRVKVPV